MLIVWGHFMPPVMAKYVYAVSVPLFFMVSGYLDKHKPWNEWWQSNLRGLIIPYLLLCAIRVGVNVCVAGGYSLREWGYVVECILTGFHSRHGIEGAGPLWFVYILFVTRLLWRCIAGRKWAEYLTSFICVVGAYIWQAYPIVHPPIATGQWTALLLAYPMFFIGQQVKQSEILARGMRVSTKAMIGIVCATICCVAAYYNGPVFVSGSYWGKNYLLYWIGALSGIAALSVLTGFLHSIPRVVKMHSLESIVTLNFHIWLIWEIKKMSVYHMYEDISAFCGTLLIMLVFWGVIEIVTRWCPVLIGGRK